MAPNLIVACPSCEANWFYQTQWRDMDQMYQCGRCKCVHGTTWEGARYDVVSAFAETALYMEAALTRSVQYELTVHSMHGPERRCGLFDPTTRLITAVL